MLWLSPKSASRAYAHAWSDQEMEKYAENIAPHYKKYHKKVASENDMSLLEYMRGVRGEQELTEQELMAATESYEHDATCVNCPDDFEGPDGSLIYHPNALVTQKWTDEIPKDFSPKCRCKTGAKLVRRGNKYKLRDKGPCRSCACVKWGYKCSRETCGCCKEIGNCQNPFDFMNLEEIFGSPNPKLTPCFAKWISRRTHKFDFLKQITLKSLVETILKAGAPVSDGYDEWKKNWDQIANDKDDSTRKIQAMRDLIGMAFGSVFEYKTKFHGYYYSFCDDSWSDSACWSHCADCGLCVGWKAWHCGKCNTCMEGLFVRCKGCRGVNVSYHGLHKNRIKSQVSRQFVENEGINNQTTLTRKRGYSGGETGEGTANVETNPKRTRESIE
ncbi:hypothetical protein IWZ01DRAFT_554963 [Phyllosticta capitalensis]